MQERERARERERESVAGQPANQAAERLLLLRTPLSLSLSPFCTKEEYANGVQQPPTRVEWKQLREERELVGERVRKRRKTTATTAGEGEREEERERELFSPLARPPAAAAVKTRWLRMVVAAAAAAGSAAAVPEDFFLE
jgi:hypothetical protein